MNFLSSFDRKAVPFELQSEMQWNGRRLDLRFVLSGSLSGLKGLGDGSEIAAHPTDGLWQSTCFEAFFGANYLNSYYEVNLAADGRWMVFYFENEREGQQICADFAPVRFSSDLAPQKYELTASFDFAKVSELCGQILKATPAAVLQTTSDEISYWSLVHTKDKPDFHAPAHRMLELKP